MPENRFVILALLVVLAACGRQLPEPGSEAYEEIVSAFYSGTSAMEVGQDLRAEARLKLVTERAPAEPSAWANLSLMAMRRGEFDAAGAHLAKARSLAEDSAPILYLSGILEQLEGRMAEAAAFMRLALESDSTYTRAAYVLAMDLEPENPEPFALLIAAEPDNLAVLVERARRAAAAGNTGELASSVERLAALGAAWNSDAKAQLESVLNVSDAGDLEATSVQLAFLRNVLLSEEAFRQDLGRLRASVEVIADPVAEFLRLESPRPAPAAADDSLEFVAQHLLPDRADSMAWIAAVALGNEALPAVFFTDGEALRTLRDESWTFPGPRVPGPHAVAALDYNYDFRTDLVMAGPGGIRLLAQDSTEAFSDVTSSMGLGAGVVDAAYSGVWAADLDLEGDIDLVLALEGLGVRPLRNNGDGTFAELDLFSDIPAPRNLVWADLDSDGDPDAVFLDGEGRLHARENLRQGRFRAWEMAREVPAAADITATDSNSDGIIDLLVLAMDGSISRLTRAASAWHAEQVAASSGEAMDGARLLRADLDNNGGFDLLVAGPERARIWLQQHDYSFSLLPRVIDARVFSLASIRQAGRLDLVGLDSEGRPLLLAVLPSKNYHWKQIRPRAAQAVGDQRINSFGIGGEVELRAGSLYQKQPITEPLLHFGLGEYALADIARITWPNGSVQAEFELLSDHVLSAQQRLKGSCPWLFTHDGEKMQFVTDFIWRSPLGLRINAQETAGIMTTEDWVKIRGDQLQARDGQYDVRITAELWETHFFDHVSLLVVDHPPGTEVFVDERFAFPPPELAVRVTGPLRPIVAATDDRGRDVSGIVRERDEQYLDYFGRGRYQGITRDHYVEIELDQDMPEASWLVAAGWIRPTDSSINVAISHGTQPPPRGLRLEVQQPDGSWLVAHGNLGFPSGKSKTVLIDLEGIPFAEGPRRLRLHTNLEVYWDFLAHAEKMSPELAEVRRLNASSAELRYRGFSAVREANRSSPELPFYEELAGTSQIWRDLVGYYTRFGDVRPLLTEVDDRYVIMNAGDEMQVLFEAQPPPAESWRRDFVLIGDGWVKDGDYNTTFSKTVRPLPAHDEPRYDRPPEGLLEDPVYRRHQADWQDYHTRFVTPERFARGVYLPRTTMR